MDRTDFSVSSSNGIRLRCGLGLGRQRQDRCPPGGRGKTLRELALEFPGYGFEKHFGYSTPQHFAALKELGPCPIHRRSFAPVRASEQLCLTFDE